MRCCRASGAIGRRQAALQPQRAGEIGDGLRRLLLLPVGDAAIEQRLGHDGRRQVAARDASRSAPARPVGLAGLEQLGGGLDGALGLGRILFLLLGLASGFGSSGSSSSAAFCCLPPAPCLASLGFAFAVLATSAPARSRTPLSARAAAASTARARLRQSRAMSVIPRPIAVGRAKHLLLGENTPIPGCRQIRAGVFTAYSTVTDLARLRGWSTSVPMNTAVW